MPQGTQVLARFLCDLMPEHRIQVTENRAQPVYVNVSTQTIASVVTRGAGSTATALAHLSPTATIVLLVFFLGAPAAEQWRRFFLRLVGRRDDDP